MRRLQTSKDPKLRSACDRCHELKNRCTRSGGVESRCDRCERLDEDCVYSTRSQVGRPRSRKQEATLAARASPSIGTPASRLVPLKDAEVRRLETTPRDGTLQLDFDSSASSSSSSSHAAHLNQHFWGVDLSVNQTGHCHDDSEWQLDAAVFMANSPPYGDNMAPSGPGKQDPIGLSLLQDGNDAVTSAGVKGDVDGTTGTLIGLQSQLQQLLSGSLKAPKEDNNMLLPTGHEAYSAVDEILDLTKNLLGIVQAQTQTNSSPGQPARHTNRITTLQIMTCYTYVLQLLDPIITSTRQQSNSGGGLEMQPAPQCPSSSSSLQHMFPASGSVNGHARCGARYPILHLGGFNLAYHPTLNDDVVQHMVQRITQQLHTSIRSFASVAGCTKIADAVEANITGGVLSPAPPPPTRGDATGEGL
ncbi:hypothetical protein LZ31DRAFT_557006 [Colletotrichum somersetense]|nr:hypothetical protein LZ31DRAFT_557006 [Colletotrichum somersetense]